MNLDRYKKLADYQIRLEPLEHEPTLVRGNGTQAPPVQVTSTLGTLMYLPAEHSIIGAALQDLHHLIAHIEQLEATLQRVEALRDEMSEGKTFCVLATDREPDYPVSYFIEYLNKALEGATND